MSIRWGLDCVFASIPGGYHGNYQNTNEHDCSRAGGKWVPGTLTDFQYDPKTNKATVEWANRDANGNITYTPATFSLVQPSPSQTSSSWLPSFTFQVGFAFNANLLGGMFNGFAGLVIDSHGHVGTYSGGGPGVSALPSGTAGVQVGVSNGNSICAISGPFVNTSGSGGDVFGGTVDAFGGKGDGPGGIVGGVSVTGPFSIGGTASTSVTYTHVSPFGGQKCP